ncbi:MAG: substrate-binding domain-containing protein [Clostridiales bacterium]|jgi:D-xylose transport system substrate-binding protein|nr:substrate-binding domain-containing protein [Clostridiales bacterium]
MRKIIALITMLSMILMCCGCQAAEHKEVTPTTKGSACTIGLSFDSFVIERWTRDRDVFVSTANELGAEVNVQSAGGDVETQISQIKRFIEIGVNAIVIITADAVALKDVVKEATGKGIPVICYDRLVRDAGADLYISFDNEAVGKQMANAICDNVPEGGTIVEIMGPESDYNVSQVMSGFDSVCKEHKMNISLTYNCDNWKPELAYEFVNDNFEVISKADAIMCGNDALAGEAIHALAERGFAGKIFVTGQDGDLEACQRLVEGTQLITVYKPVEKLARLAAEYAVKLATGKSLGETDTFFDGTQDIPYIAIEPAAVTRENLDAVIIDSGFHLREEVYLNGN